MSLLSVFRTYILLSRFTVSVFGAVRRVSTRNRINRSHCNGSTVSQRYPETAKAKIRFTVSGKLCETVERLKYQYIFAVYGFGYNPLLRDTAPDHFVQYLVILPGPFVYLFYLLFILQRFSRSGAGVRCHIVTLGDAVDGLCVRFPPRLLQ